MAGSVLVSQCDEEVVTQSPCWRSSRFRGVGRRSAFPTWNMGSVTQSIFRLWQQTGLTAKEVWESSQEEVTGGFKDKRKFLRQKKLEVSRGGISDFA